ncbi:RING finger protein 212B-like isoform X2 [Cimex lectularius]|uniref:RING-type domain-containing protein n=1 Tax=Cimex lectularius TaxID=79782 RepID=A0A8I6R666_CIMLE|nr:RING finger protein 212B-like isoform X2 [Cimex lectularius]XP_014239652.1 RING finger protein 212B-like isoform X2 [Cimex lectularius]XP_024082708.1 RING finger protein 212B-like isoform X2 [Cimex lectularius]
MFWVFCTSCFTRPSQESNRKFFVTNCCHVICEQCFNKEQPMCRRCATPCKVILCNSEMPNEIKELFSDANEKASTFLKVLDYQNTQRFKLMSYYKINAQKYSRAKPIFKDLEMKYYSLEKKNASLVQKCFSLENHIEELNRKLGWYASKSFHPSTSYKSPFQQTSFHDSPDEALNTMSQNFARSQATPYSSMNMGSMFGNSRVKNASPFSSESSHTPLINSLSSNSSLRNKIHSFTPPSKTIELLSQLNKSRRPF